MKRAKRSSEPIRRKKQATSFELPSFFSLDKSMPPPPSPKTAEAADPLPIPTGAATRMRTTSSGSVVASRRHGRWLLRRCDEGGEDKSFFDNWL